LNLFPSTETSAHETHEMTRKELSYNEPCFLV
jgi:hypothetical protein